MKNRWRKLCVIILAIIAGFPTVSTNAQQSLTQINGWNAYVHLPTGYATSSNTYPTIIFFPGIGEIGTSAGAVISNGPGAYLAQGWNGNVTVDGTTVEFIVISLQPPAGFPNEALINQRIQTIKSLYRVDLNRLYLTGLSHGGWCGTTFVTGDNYGGPYTYASQIAAVVTVQGMRPDDNTPYPGLFDNFALSGGKYLGFEQINDGRDTRTVVERMNATVANSAVYVQTAFGNGGHCCWNQFYGGQGTQPGNFNLSGTTQNLYQWLARQSLANNSNTPPVSNAGPDLSITLPVNTAILNGSGSDADGTVTSFLWNQVAGPSAATLLNGNTAIATINNLIQGQYKFTLRVTDNATASSTDTVTVTVNPNPASLACNSNAPVTHYLNYTQPGEIYRPNGSLWKGGDTVKITGTNYSVIEFYNIAGDPCRPIVIMPATTLTTPVFRIKGNSRYLKIWGGNSPYGIKVNGGSLAITMSHHIEADNIECFGGSIGVYCKQDVVYADTMTWHPNYRMTKLTFKNLWIHDINGEGMYVGITQPNGLTVQSTYSGLDTVIIPIRLDSVEISNCLVERTNWDGIQLSNARNGNKIFNNTVRNYGILNISSQQAGIILGSNCNGDVYGNTVTKGTGNGIQVFGYGVINVFNNLLDSCGYSGSTNSNGTEGQQSLYASDYLISTDNNPKQTINAFGNSIYRPKSAGGIFITDYFNNSFPSAVYNNSFCIPNAPANWESIYIKAYVPGSSVSNNILSCSAVNLPPVANAGSNINIALPVNLTVLTGSGSDPDGTIASYQWQKIAGPSSGGILLTPNAALATAISLEQGTYSFELTVTDNAGATGKDTVNVIVAGLVNQLPSANAGGDINITLPVNSTTLYGDGTDPDGTIAAYHWNLIAGPGGSNIANSNAQVTAISNLNAGTYSYELMVTDNAGGTGKDTVTVFVNPALNQSPVANAGNNITITLPVNYSVLSGTGTDSDGSIISYNWNLINGPSGSTIIGSNLPSANISDLVAGLYYYELTVSDNSGAIGKDTVEVMVNMAINQLPVANAGNNISITLPVNTAILNGAGTDADGTIASYSWQKIEGPVAGTLSDANLATATAASLEAGVYAYQLTVTDNVGGTGKDTVYVSVNVPGNSAPFATAGPDTTITLPVNNIVLNGSGSDADGTIVSYMWVKINGSAAGTITNAATSVTSVTGLTEGYYRFELTVTDNDGAIGRDTLIVNVNPAPNQPPVANAGTDVNITLPTNTAALNGSGTDYDGNIVSYTWIKIAGPASGIITNAGLAVTSATGLVQGVYSFQLTVTDNSGATSRDTMQVTVNAAPNQLPIANAGPDVNITLPLNNCSLNGSATDPDGSIISYAWLKITGPSAGIITNAGAAVTTTTGLVQGVYRFQLTVTDNSGATSRDTMQVTVNAAPNQLPAANAGPDVNITLPLNNCSLNGSATDPDGSIISYAWLKIAGPSAGIITNAGAAVTTATGLVQGIYRFQLTATDNNGAIARDTMQVTVNAAPNQLPIANAGLDVNITLPVNSCSLSGSATDPDGSIISYAWLKIAGPSAGIITNAGAAVTTATGLVQGVYRFQLTVTDNSGALNWDTMQVTVNPAGNQPPVANAGPDKNLTLPVSSTLLNGSGIDPDGSIASYTWIKLAGPAAGTLSNANSATASLTNLVQGIYSYQLTVTDNLGELGRDTLIVFVNAAPNQLPTANAGNNITITLPVNSVVLDGSGTDPDGTITSYIWLKISGPAAGAISNAATALTNATGLVQGLYLFQLTVTDNSGAIARDTVQVTVNAALNEPPVANAGADITITLPQNSAVLTGSATDPDGTVASYSWIKVSGPSAGIIANAATASATLTNLEQGVYSYRLTVTDNSGATASDMVNVTVEAAANQIPHAFAGDDVSIYLPQDSLEITGAGTDADGTIVSYAWRMINATGQYLFTNATLAQTKITGLEQGLYELELTVTDNNGAKGYDTISVSVGSSRQTISSENVNIYPNPVSNRLNIQIESPKTNINVTLHLFDNKGALVYQKISRLTGYTKLETIEMGHLKAGTYFLEVKYGYSKQLVKTVVKLN